MIGTAVITHTKTEPWYVLFYNELFQTKPAAAGRQFLLRIHGGVDFIVIAGLVKK